MNETKVSLPRKGKAQIGFYLTVPFVTQIIILNDTLKALHPLMIHSNIISMSENSCKGSIGVDQCTLEIKAYSYDDKTKYELDDWRKTHYITVYHIDSDGYNFDKTATLSLKTSEIQDGFFHHMSLDNTSIEIFEAEERWKGKSCGSKTDPHLYTFDGVAFDSHIAGEFILYRNWKYNQEVQTRHEKCHAKYPFPQCTCAVSIQSGKDVFMIDICENNNFMDFLICQDNVIEVYKITDKNYKVLLPTGTSVSVSLVEWPVEGSWQIDLDIYPSLADVNNTEGLCGTLDGDRENEFTNKSGSSLNLDYPDDFSRSWIVQNHESILNGVPSDRPSISSTLDKICTCPISGEQCSYQTSSQCSKPKGKQFHCTRIINQVQPTRKKRAVQLNSNLESSAQGNIAISRQKRELTIYVTNQTIAEDVCKSAFISSAPFRTCEQYVSDMTNSSLSNCIMDVRLTGDVNIPVIHIEAAFQQCIQFLDLNTTLKTEQPDVTYQLQSLCSNNCSGHGVCTEGNCTCDSGFGGSDCSFNVRSPPSILYTAPNRTCDLSSRTCSEVLLEGRYFLENIKKTCFIRRELVHHNNTIVYTSDTEEPLDDRTLFQGACPLPEDNRVTWITKFTFKISYDRNQFSPSYSIYKYQSECQQISYVNGAEQVNLKADYCFIDNTCIRNGAFKPGNICEVCYPSSQKFEWSLHEDCILTTLTPTTKDPFTSLAFIITVSAASSIVLVTLLVVFLVCRCRSSTRRAFNDYDSTRDMNVPGWRRHLDVGENSQN
ncbi:von Willebrand factor D and EGF domain-containing protein-like, partial [Saccostrea cucullata]|uniref:von Willebrand factor D and EGF domain-containing protein-like n=1 Tax=Saccostrea cuccullata TaxID=36930 RepID=UPI002ED454AE